MDKDIGKGRKRSKRTNKKLTNTIAQINTSLNCLPEQGVDNINDISSDVQCDPSISDDNGRLSPTVLLTKNKRKSSNSCLLITGPAGVGKTTLIDVITKEMGFRVNYVTPNNMITTKTSLYILESHYHMIHDDMTAPPEQIVVVFDDLDVLNSNTHKKQIACMDSGA